MHKRLLCLLALLLCLCACGAKGPSPEERITALVTTLYTCPDEQQKENWSAWFRSDGPESQGKAISARLNYNRSRFRKDDFAEGALESVTRYFAEEDIYRDFHFARYSASISCTSVESERQEDGSWVFTAPVTLTTQNGLQYDFIHTGTVLFDNRNRITDVQITDDGGMRLFATPGFPVPTT